MVYIADHDFGRRAPALLREHGLSVQEELWQSTPEDRPLCELTVQKDKASVKLSGRAEGNDFQFTLLSPGSDAVLNVKPPLCSEL